MQALEVLTKAFQLFPRLGYISQPAGGRGGDTTVVFRSWSSNAANQIRYHNEAMKCCGLSIREISKRRALWHDRSRGEQRVAAPAAPDAEMAVPAAPPLMAPQPATPPTGR